MPSRTDIVAHGGWVRQETFRKPRMERYCAVSAGWLPLSDVASVPFWEGWPASFGWLAGLGLLVGVVQLWWLGRVAFLAVTERPVRFMEEIPNPDFDPRNLY